MLAAISDGDYYPPISGNKKTYSWNRNCFKSDKVAEISYASRLFILRARRLYLTVSSNPGQGLSCPKVPQQLRHARGAPLPTEGGQAVCDTI